eukprot:4673678-Pyramimonas_sp.AAC.1
MENYNPSLTELLGQKSRGGRAGFACGPLKPGQAWAGSRREIGSDRNRIGSPANCPESNRIGI